MKIADPEPTLENVDSNQTIKKCGVGSVLENGGFGSDPEDTYSDSILKK